MFLRQFDSMFFISKLHRHSCTQNHCLNGFIIQSFAQFLILHNTYFHVIYSKKNNRYLTIFPDFSYKINAFSSGKSTFNKINMISSLFKISLAFCNDKRNKHLSLRPDIFHHLIFVIFNNQFTLLSFKLY